MITHILHSNEFWSVVVATIIFSGGGILLLPVLAITKVFAFIGELLDPETKKERQRKEIATYGHTL